MRGPAAAHHSFVEWAMEPPQFERLHGEVIVIRRPKNLPWQLAREKFGRDVSESQRQVFIRRRLTTRNVVKPDSQPSGTVEGRVNSGRGASRGD